MSEEADLLRQHMTRELGLEVRDLEQLGVDAYNRHYRVVIDGELRHVVAYNLPPELPLMGVRFEQAVIRLLQERGYAEVPRVVIHEGESLFRAGDVFYSISEWIDGCHDQQELPVSRAQLADAARALADLHAATAGAELRLDYFPEHVFVYPLGDFLDARDVLLERLEERVHADPLGTFSPAAVEAVEWFLPRARAFFAAFPRDLYQRVRAADPTGVVHGDYRRMNLVFAPGKVVRVLDYNCCFNEVRLWDVAYGALSMAGKETVGPVTDPAEASAFVRAYHRCSPLSADERALLPHMLTFVLAKLMTGAIESWWLTDRTDTLQRFLDGEAEAIARDALAEE